MDKSIFKRAIKAYQNAGANFITSLNIPLKKEADLALLYYPGVDYVMDKISKKRKLQDKLCAYNKTIGIISTKSQDHYPVLTARAALVSHLTGVNAIPLMIKYGKVHNLPDIIKNLSVNFRAIYCSDFSSTEKAVIMENSPEIPVFFQDEVYAATHLAAIISAGKYLKSNLKKARISIEGTGPVLLEVVKQLDKERAGKITLIDERGPLYHKRPNMNYDKNRLVSIQKPPKDTRTYEQVLAETEIYVYGKREELNEKICQMLPDKAVIISNRAENISKKPKQSVISTLPQYDNHISDLHVLIGLINAIIDGKKFNEKSLSQATYSLASVYKSPSVKKMIPGLLEKNLAKKIAKGIK